MSSFRVATCAVTLDGYGDPKGTALRMTRLLEAASELVRSRVDIFSLPGGYLFASDDAHLATLQEQVKRLAVDRGIDLLVGIDTALKNTHPDPWLVHNGKLGAWAVCASRDGRVVTWRQRSITSEDQHLVSGAVCREEHLVRVAPRVESLICGEIFNGRIRSGLVARRTALVIDQAHIAAGFRVFAAMKILASGGIPSLCSLHADVRGAVKYCYVPGLAGWESKSSRAIDLEIGSRPRLEIKIWECDSAGKILVL